MKRLITILAAFALVAGAALQAQKANNQLNQQELMKKLIGKWQVTPAGDTASFFEIKKYTNTLLQLNTHKIKDKQFIDFLYVYRYMPREARYLLSGYQADGTPVYWKASFTAADTFTLLRVADAKSEQVLEKREARLLSPVQLSITYYAPDGNKTGEALCKKIE